MSETAFSGRQVIRLHDKVCKAIGVHPRRFTSAEVLGPLVILMANVLASAPTEKDMHDTIEDTIKNLRGLAAQLRADPIMTGKAEKVADATTPAVLKGLH